MNNQSNTLPDKAKIVAILSFILAAVLTIAGLASIAKSVWLFLYFIAMAIPFILVGFIVLRNVDRSCLSRRVVLLALISMVFTLGTGTALAIGTILYFIIPEWIVRYFFVLWFVGITAVGLIMGPFFKSRNINFGNLRNEKSAEL